MQVTQNKYPKLTVSTLAAAVIALSATLAYKTVNGPSIVASTSSAKVVESPVKVAGVVASNDAVDVVYKKAVDSLAGYPEFAGKTKISQLPMDQVSEFQRSVGDSFFPVLVDNVIYMTESTGTTLLQPASDRKSVV